MPTNARMIPKDTEVLLLTHLGLGDQIICNAIIRMAVQAYGVVALPVKASIMESIAFMLRDLQGQVHLVQVPDRTHRNGGERYLFEIARRWGGCCQNLTMFERQQERDREYISTMKAGFDVNFYRYAGLDIGEKFRGFHVERDRAIELPVPKKPYALLHDEDAFPIRAARMQVPMTIHHLHDFKIGNIFSLWGIIEGAAELHLINSGPMNLTDFISPGGKLVWHRYARQEISYPTLQCRWDILD